MTIKRMLLCVLSASLLLCMTACGEKKTEKAPDPDPAMPTTAAQIIGFYNDAIGRAVDSRLSLAKRYRSKEDKFSLSPVLDPFKSRLRDDTGVKQNMDDVIVTPDSVDADRYEQILRRSSLTEADVKKAKCTLTKTGLYRIGMVLQDGESHVSPDKNEYTSALDKCGIFAGDTMNLQYDHKTAQNIFEDVGEYASDIRIDEQQTNVKIVAVFRPDGTPMQLTIRFDTAYSIKSVYEIGLSAKGSTTVRYLQFGAEAPVFPEEDE